MHSFQKPENALKRAAELKAIGHTDEALSILHSAIGHKSFKIQGWDMVQEQIMMEYVALCIEQENIRMARDGLHLYRLIAQHANVASLGKVIVELLDLAEARLVKLKATAPKTKPEKKPYDPDAEDAAVRLMTSMLLTEIPDEYTKKLNEEFKFLWEIYKMVLDIMRATPKLERVYHETARKAVTFCRENTRTVEFKRLCDILRGHYSFLLKVQSKPEMECMLKPELHIETRINQMVAACDLSMWKEAFNTVEDLYTLGIRDYIFRTFQGPSSVLGQQKEKLLKWLSLFYEKLALIFWVSDLKLFHAIAIIRYIMHVKMYKRKVPEDEISYLCSKCVVAVLSIPEDRVITPPDTELNYESSAVLDMKKRMATLLGYHSVPSKESIINSMPLKVILTRAEKNVQDLFRMIQTRGNKMRMCCRVLPLLEKLGETKKFTPSDDTENPPASNSLVMHPLGVYVKKIKPVVLHKVVASLCRVYSTMEIEFFRTFICPPEYYHWGESERQIANLINDGYLLIRFDYTDKMLEFNKARIGVDTVEIFKNHLTDLGRNLYLGVRMIVPEDVNKNAEQNQIQIMTVRGNLEKERIRLLQRSDQIYQRRLEHLEEQQRIQEEKKRMELQQKINEERLEKERREEVARQLEVQRKKDEKLRTRTETATYLVGEIKKMCSQAGAKINVRGKPLDEVTVEDLLDGIIEYEDLEKAQEEQMLKERQECMRIRKQELKKLDHFLRAIRESDQKLYEQHERKIVDQDIQLLLEVQRKREDKHKVDSEARLEEKRLFSAYVEDKNVWVEEQMEERKKQYEKMKKEQRERFIQMLKQEKIHRAKERYKREQKKKMEEEKARKLEEMRLKEAERLRKQQEEELRKKREEEMHMQKLNEIAEIQRQKQLEIEARLLATTYGGYEQVPQRPRGREVYGKQNVPVKNDYRRADGMGGRDGERDGFVTREGVKPDVRTEVERDGMTRNNYGVVEREWSRGDGDKNESEPRSSSSPEGWRSDSKRRGFRGFNRRDGRSPGEDEDNWRR